LSRALFNNTHNTAKQIVRNQEKITEVEKKIKKQIQQNKQTNKQTNKPTNKQTWPHCKGWYKTNTAQAAQFQRMNNDSASHMGRACSNGCTFCDIMPSKTPDQK
jgi:hypothetical protein